MGLNWDSSTHDVTQPLCDSVSLSYIEPVITAASQRYCNLNEVDSIHEIEWAQAQQNDSSLVIHSYHQLRSR